ncbi:unnamed protein product, partial [Prorocentrum cordatum]
DAPAAADPSAEDAVGELLAELLLRAAAPLPAPAPAPAVEDSAPLGITPVEQRAGRPVTERVREWETLGLGASPCERPAAGASTAGAAELLALLRAAAEAADLCRGGALAGHGESAEADVRIGTAGF